MTTAVLCVHSYRTLDQYCQLDDATGREDEVALLYGGVHVARVERGQNGDAPNPVRPADCTASMASAGPGRIVV